MKNINNYNLSAIYKHDNDRYKIYIKVQDKDLFYYIVKHSKSGQYKLSNEEAEKFINDNIISNVTGDVVEFFNGGIPAIMYKSNGKDFISSCKVFLMKNGDRLVSASLLVLLIYAFSINQSQVHVSADDVTVEISQNDTEESLNILVEKPNVELSSVDIKETKELTRHNSVDKEKFTKLLKDFVVNSNSFDPDYKHYIIKSKLIDDVVESCDDVRLTELIERFHDITIKYYDDVIYDDENECEIEGYYNPTEENVIHIYSGSYTKDDTIAHEFIHLLQDNNEYRYIRESCASLLSNEYFENRVCSYSNGVLRMLKLSEIVGDDIVWNLCFNGNTKEFEESIYDLLIPSDAEEFLNLLKVNPNNKSIDKIDEKIDLYLSKMYKNKYDKDIEDDSMMQYLDYNYQDGFIYEKPGMYQKGEDQEYTYIEQFDLREAIEHEKVSAKFYINEFERGTLENYNETTSKIEYADDLYGMHNDKGEFLYYRFSDPDFELSLEEAYELGLIDIYVVSNTKEVSFEEFLEYINDTTTSYSSKDYNVELESDVDYSVLITTKYDKDGSKRKEPICFTSKSFNLSDVENYRNDAQIKQY